MVEIFGALFFAHVEWVDGWMTWPRSDFCPLALEEVLGFYHVLSVGVLWVLKACRAVFAYRESGCFYHFLLLVADLLKLIRVAGRRAEG